jgi:hypothetical protein
LVWFSEIAATLTELAELLQEVVCEETGVENVAVEMEVGGNCWGAQH